MPNDLKKIQCTPDCGFMVQSHDGEEVMKMAKDHAEEKHNKMATDEELRAMMQSV